MKMKKLLIAVVAGGLFCSSPTQAANKKHKVDRWQVMQTCNDRELKNIFDQINAVHKKAIAIKDKSARGHIWAEYNILCQSFDMKMSARNPAFKKSVIDYYGQDYLNGKSKKTATNNSKKKSGTGTFSLDARANTPQESWKSSYKRSSALFKVMDVTEDGIIESAEWDVYWKNHKADVEDGGITFHEFAVEQKKTSREKGWEFVEENVLRTFNFMDLNSNGIVSYREKREYWKDKE